MEKKAILLKTILAYLPVVSLLAVVCTLPFYYGNVLRWSLISFFFTFLLDYAVNQRYNAFTWNAGKWTFFVFICFFLMTYLWNIGGETSYHFLRVVNYRLPYLGFGVVGILGLNDKFRLRYFIYAALLTSVLIILFLLFQTQFNPFERVGESNLFNQVRVRYINSHMIANNYFNLTLIGVAYLLLNKTIAWRAKIAIALAGLLVYFAVFISEGRSGQLASFLIVSFVSTFAIWRWKKWLLLPLFFALALLATSLFYVNPRIERAVSQGDERFVLWRVAVELIVEKPICGYGISAAREKYVETGLNDSEFCERYANSYFLHAQNLGHTPDVYSMSPHNAYLDTWLQNGILGVLVLFASFILPLFYPTCNRLFLLLIVMVFALQCMFDTIGTHLSALAYTMWICLWCQSPDDKLRSFSQENEN